MGAVVRHGELIDTLAHSKITSTAIKSRMVKLETTCKEIGQPREGYRCVAVRGSFIYFELSNLALVDPMYQYSLQTLVSQTCYGWWGLRRAWEASGSGEDKLQ